MIQDRCSFAEGGEKKPSYGMGFGCGNPKGPGKTPGTNEGLHGPRIPEAVRERKITETHDGDPIPGALGSTP
jgi:hypothetical protein